MKPLFLLKKVYIWCWDMTNDGNLESEMKKRESGAFHVLSARCFDREGLSINTKSTVYKAVVVVAAPVW